MNLVSYHNDPTLKEDMLAEMKIHYEQDALVKGTYARMNGHFKGCAVGCGVESLRTKRKLEIKHDDHASYAQALGIPEWLARLEDTLFEQLPEKESKEFPLQFLKAIPLGVNLEPVKWRFCALILKENIERVLALKIKDNLKKQVVGAIQGVLSLHEKAAETGKWDESAARSAASAAWSAASAAWSAESAESAARSAASAAWSAESAARSAESAAWSAESAAWSAASAAWSAESAAWSAARSAARSAAWSAARSAARSAAWSAASAAWSAESAAWSAARSAARSAAWSAAESAARSAAWSAESAARSAAWSAARSAAYLKYANYLLKLLRESK